MHLKTWLVLGIVVTVYVGYWVVYIVRKYRYIQSCPVAFWVQPQWECFRCPNADHCGRVSQSYKHWGCSPETLRELDQILETRRTELEQSAAEEEQNRC